MWSGRRDSNPQHPAWEADTLPLRYARSLCIEHTDNNFGLTARQAAQAEAQMHG